jgi:KaiC/GvpD/RAD55 family RecA-like ATPase
MVDRLRTGIDVLDRKLDGGLPAGSVLALRAAPASQAELLLYAFTVPRETLYLTLDRTELAVADSLRRTAVATGDPTIQYVEDDARVDHAVELVRELPENSTLIINPHTRFESMERAQYQELMNKLRLHVLDTESIAILHCLEGHEPPPLRDTTLHMADVVFDLRTQVAGSQIENSLAIPKFRGGRALTEPIKLQLAEGIRIDTSRDIG